MSLSRVNDNTVNRIRTKRKLFFDSISFSFSSKYQMKMCIDMTSQRVYSFMLYAVLSLYKD